MPVLVAIQSLRALAALAVAVLHAGHEAAGLGGGAAGDGPRSLVWEAGVDVFFVVSGFVMVHASERLFGRPGMRGGFLARRVARVVPLYWLATGAVLLLALAAPGALREDTGPSPAVVAASFLFVPFPRPDGSLQPLYSLGWTLNYEMFFYGLFAVALGLPRRRAVAAVVAALAALVLLGRLVPLPQPLAFWADPIVLEFAVGAALGLFRAEGVRLGGAARLALVLAAVSAFAAAAPGFAALGLPRVLAYGLPAAFLVAAAGLGRGLPAAERSVATRLAAALGDASYALYLAHPFVLRGARVALGAAGVPLPGPAFLFLGLMATVAAALAVHRFVELPLTRLARHTLRAPPGRGVSA